MKDILTSTPYPKAKLLVVDDQLVNLKFIEGIVGKAGYSEITMLSDELKCIDTYVDIQPHLLLLDMNMPKKHGLDILAEINKIESSPFIPVLVLTAETDKNLMHKAYNLGAQDYLLKPIDQIELLIRIRNLLEIRYHHNYLQDKNKVLKDMVTERTHELKETRLDIIHRLGKVAEYRDKETGNHIIRMSRYSAILAREYGLSEEHCDLILQASPMHDIGKVGIPDKVLLKDSEFNDDEWEIMKSHTVIGAEILSNGKSKLLQLAESMALNHQERWNGSGYPNGLKGEDIPIEARIISICDVFDALTSKRPYKDPWPLDKTVKYIEDKGGSQFDPNLTKLIKTVLPKFLEVRGNYND